MPKVIFLTFDGAEYALDVPVGTTLMRAATDHGVPGIDGDCGGVCACATCHVHVDERWLAGLPPPSQLEREMLNFTNDPRADSRLACQIEIGDAQDGIVVTMPEGQH